MPCERLMRGSIAFASMGEWGQRLIQEKEMVRPEKLWEKMIDKWGKVGHYGATAEERV